MRYKRNARLLRYLSLITYLSIGAVPALAASSTPTPVPSDRSPGPSQSTNVADQGMKISLDSFPAFVGAEGHLTASISVTNRGNVPMTGLRVVMTIFDGIKTRSQLERTFAGKPGTVVSTDTVPVDGELAPGLKRTIAIDKPLSEIAFFHNAEDRAYPVRFIVKSDRSTSTSIDTHMIYFTAPQQFPLKIALIIPLHSPSIYTSGNRPGIVTSNSLEKSVTNGRLTSILNALESNPDTAVTISPSGLLVDMLADLSDGFAASNRKVSPDDPPAARAATALEAIRSIAGRASTAVISAPYSQAFLPALVRADLTDVAQAQVVEGREAIAGERSASKMSPLDGWLLPVKGALDEKTLSTLQLTKISHLVLSPRSLRTRPSPLTPSAQISIRTRSGPALQGIADDPGLDERLLRASTVSPLIARQRFLAETATIMLERPGTDRTVAAVAPLDWNVSQSFLSDVLGTLGNSPWLKPVTVDQIGPAPAATPAHPNTELAPTDDVQKLAGSVPGGDFFNEIVQARKAIDRYGDLYPPQSQIDGLERRLLIAESADWWASPASVRAGQSFARAIPTTVRAEFAKIRAPASQTITLTSHNGVIPLSISSQLDYPVFVVLKLNSDKLRFPDGDKIRIDKLQSPNKTITVKTITQATGTFVLDAVVETSSGTRIASSRLTVRSTAYNVVGLAITGGAAVFLVAWWLAGIARRRLPA
ncbi:MAG: DUF6049 family protein [Actinomycetota bacterium]|nr:DUF6049 family protein [Actinomycetota bacterium]